MKVCHITPLPPVRSGISQYSHEFISELKQKGIDGFALSTGDLKTDFDVLDFPWLNFNKAFAEVERRKPDLIHYQHGGSYKNYFVIFSNLILRRRLKLPSVITLHDAPFISLVKLSKVEPVRKLVWQVFSRKLEARLCHLADIITVNSRYAKNLICSYYNVSEDKIRVIPYGIALGRHNTNMQEARTSLSLPKEDVIMLSGGLLYPGRGLKELLFAFSKIDRKMRLIVFGDGPLLDSLKRLSFKLAIEDKVTFTGYVPVEKMIMLMKACDFVTWLKKSTVGETSSVIVNALAAGKPVITTQVGTNPELVIQGENGFLVRLGDEEALVEAISTLSHNSSLREEMGLKSQKMAESLSWDIICDQVIKVYEQVTS